MGAVDSRARVWVPVLLYHRVVPEPPRDDPFGNFVSVRSFESHLRWMHKRGYKTVPLASLESIFTERREPRLSRSVAITFDDGYADNYHYAWPLLKRYGFEATVFVVTNAIGEDSSFDPVYPAAPMLTLEQLREMHRDGITFGSHSCSHPSSLVDLTQNELALELTTSKRVLEGVLDAPVTLFAYPHSRHDARVEDAVASAGYQMAFGGTGTRFSRYCLTRVQTPDGTGAKLALATHWRRLKWQVKGR